MTDATTNDSVATANSVGKLWWILALFGAITVAFGIILTIKPGKSVHTIAVIFGIWLLILGVVRLIQAITASGERTGFVVTGLLAILIAIILLHHTTTTVAVVGFIVGIFWTISGAAQLMYGFTANEGKISWPIVLLGAIGLAVGILCLVYPSLSLSIICVIVGLGLIVYGLVEILASFQVRELKKI
jgi:uncharacterized membrane protein HdeD (DUF308 family)